MKKSISPESEPSTGTTLAATNQSAPLSTDLGGYQAESYDDVDRDVGIPVLGLVNNVGPLAKAFKGQQGKFALGDLLLGEVVRVIPVELGKFFRETWRNGVELKYGSPESATAKIFATAQDAAKAGYAVDFDNKFANRVEESGKIGYLVLAPDGDQSGEFVVKLGENFPRGAKAKCQYNRGGYREVFRKVFDHGAKLATAKEITTKGLNHTQIFNAAQGWTHQWEVFSVEIDGRQNSWYEPRIRKVAPLPADVIAKITADFAKNYS